MTREMPAAGDEVSLAVVVAGTAAAAAAAAGVRLTLDHLPLPPFLSVS